jgi:PAS domain S-box-containing protein
MSAAGKELPVSKAHTALEERFGPVLASIPEAVIVINPTGRIVLANDCAERLFGYSPGELPGKPVESLLPPRLREIHPGKFGNHFTSGKADRFVELSGFRKNHSEFPIAISHKPLPAEAGNCELCVIHDLTERKTIEQKLARKAAELEALQQEFQAFSHSISHDLRAPVRALSGFAGILKKSLGENLSEDSAHALRRVQDNVVKMGKLIDGLLDYSALSWVAMTTRTFNPSDLAQKSFEELCLSNHGRQIDFSVGQLPPCQADLMLLRRLFDNLLSNAVKFTRQREPAVIRVGSHDDNGERAYFVQDNGAGFDMEYAGKLFHVFQRLHSANDFEGTGIGLAIVQRIVQRHGGRVWAHGEVDRGATFYFTLGNLEPISK